ncbi:MucR family transcriptional regulator [Sphingobium sp. H39-3-25]|uniref:MucR family transcriptional regulator n=1 Tax=Sphingomonadales TaxID=204457 RepID=UPI00082FB5F1|nr:MULTISPECIES: MucR family transcriptional regulator [Sphingomonadaceae]MDF0491563.1 MucR family transcriptional regulator [Sphingomonas pollutisoli]MDF0544002.1 MucR family transcriptional regulator [Sphingobium arseniciresistens]
MAENDHSGVMSLTVTLLSAYFANNTVPSSELPALVEGTRRALLGPGSASKEVPVTPADRSVAETPSAMPPIEVEPEAAAAESTYKPAVSIEESLASPDQILSLIDGKPYKALKRHLSTHGLTPAEYRARYGLPAGYPLVAPSYSAARREVARKLGLGSKRKSASAPAAEEAPASPIAGAVESVHPEATPAKTAPARRARAKAVAVEPKPAAKKAKRKTTKAGVAKAPAATTDTAPKPKRSRARKATGETTAPTGAAPQVAPAE